MIATMYKRRMKISLTIAVIIFIIGIVVVLIERPTTIESWSTISLIGVSFLFMGVVAITSRQNYLQVKDVVIPKSSKSILEVNHLVLKKEPGFFPRMLCFEKSGNYIGTFKPVRIPWLFYPLSLIHGLVSMLPILYGFISSESEVLFTFKRRGLKQTIVTIKNREGLVLGQYKREDFKSLVNIKGELKDADGGIILPVKVKGFSGDFTLNDDNGKRWAHFYNGYFPHENTNLFRDTDNDIVEVTDTLSENDKILLLAMIGFMFLERKR